MIGVHPPEVRALGQGTRPSYKALAGATGAEAGTNRVHLTEGEPTMTATMPTPGNDHTSELLIAVPGSLFGMGRRHV